MLFFARQYIFKLPQWLRLLSVLTSDDAVVVDLLVIVAPTVLSWLFYASQYIFKPLSGFGCCLFLQTMTLLLLIYCLLLLPLFCAVLCQSVYIQAPQWLRLLSVLKSDDAVVVDLLFIFASIVVCCLMPVSIYSRPSVVSAVVCSHKR